MQESLALLLTNRLQFIETEPIPSHDPEAQLLLHRINRYRRKAVGRQTNVTSESKDGFLV
jgi:hypothetical protein